MSFNFTSTRFLQKLYAWSLEGVDFSFDGNGGIGCRDHVTLKYRIIETIIGMTVPTFAYVLYFSCFKNSKKTMSLNKSDKVKILYTLVYRVTFKEWTPLL